MNNSFIIVDKGIKYVVILLLLFFIAFFYFSAWLSLCFLALLLLAVMVYYNPERIPFEEADKLIIAPVDGVVKSIRHNGQDTIITISSPPCFVGVLRFPIQGKVLLCTMKGFCFCSFKEKWKCLSSYNEFTSISSYGEVVCRCYPLFVHNLFFFSAPLEAKKGQRIGFMSYGILELKITAMVHLNICEGNKIKGGETTIGAFA